MQEVRIRPADPERDYAAYASLFYSCDPRVVHPELLREQDAEVIVGTFLERFLAERDGHILAAGSAYRIIWDPPTVGRIGVWVTAEARRRGLGSAMASHVEQVARAKGMTTIETVTMDTDPGARRFAESRGYELRAHCFESTLDLREFDPNRFADWVLPEGVRFFALSEIPMDEPAQREFWDLNTETSRDEPSNDPNHRPTFEQFANSVLTARWFDPSLQIVAADGEEWIGLSAVGEVTEGGWENLFTAVRRKHRGRGIAKALKVIALSRAKQKGATIVRTDNDSRNAPMIAINRALGYRDEPGWLKWSKA